MQRVPFRELQKTIATVLVGHGVSQIRAQRCATLFAETTRDGVYTHGLNRLPRMLAMIRNGSVLPDMEAVAVFQNSAVEQWDGRRGIGNLNAEQCMNRAMELADEFGIGCVALRNTNHWMRGGTYGWQAADRGYFAICWTNTNPNTPAWGTTGASLGNNPLVMAVPRIDPATSSYEGGPHVVLDVAMSQFSYGQIDAHIARNEPLSVPGGYDTQGNLTTDPQEIRKSFRALPIGFWKGSGLAMMLDLFAAMLSNGRATYEISVDPLLETGLSQMFFAIRPTNVTHAEDLTRIVNSFLEALETAPRVDAQTKPRYPGEQTLKLREENMRLGVPVEDSVWAEICKMATGQDQT